MENLKAHETNDAALVKGSLASEELNLHGVFHFECFDKDGNLKWSDVGYNIVTNQGKNGMMDTYLGLSPALATGWYMSLITAGTAISTSTYASPTVTEITTGIITSNLRVTMGWSASSTGSKAATTTAFTITGTATITGNLVCTATASGTTVGNTAGAGGILFSSSAFSGGSKNVSSGDTLNVTYGLTI